MRQHDRKNMPFESLTLLHQSYLINVAATAASRNLTLSPTFKELLP